MAQGIAHRPLVPAYHLTVQVQVISLGIGFSGVALQKGTVIPVRDKTDVLTVMLPGGDKAVFLGNLTDFRLGQFPQGKQNVLQLLLGQTSQKIGLIFGSIPGLIQ